MWCCLRFLGTTIYRTGTGGMGKKMWYKVLTDRGGVIRRFVQVELVTGTSCVGAWDLAPSNPVSVPDLHERSTRSHCVGDT